MYTDKEEEKLTRSTLDRFCSLYGIKGLCGNIQKKAGITQLVECKLPKLDVAGSIPVARSIVLQFSYGEDL